MILSDLSIKRPVLATVMSIMVGLIGAISYRDLTVREYPNIDPPVVGISTDYTGANAEIVESQVTQVLEDSIAGIEGIDFTSSVSRPESSQITVTFRLTRDANEAANDVRDRVSRVRGLLPDETDDPVIRRVEADAQPIMYIAVGSDNHSELEITDYADRYIKDRIQTLPGVAQALILGERRYAMRLWLDPMRLAAFNLTVQDVEAALRNQNVEIPAGRIESANREFTVQAQTDLKTPDEFDQMIVRAKDGYLVRLKDVGYSELGASNDRIRARLQGKTLIGLGIVKQATANPLDVSRAVREQIDHMNRNLPDGYAHDGRLRFVGVHREIDRERVPFHRRGRGPGGSDHLPVPAIVPRGADSGGHHSGRFDRHLRDHAGIGLFHQYADPARHRSGGWSGRR